MTGFCRREESGFTLVELLVAIAILMIGLVAVMQWFPLGTAGVETGRRQSTGVFLAEQKLEQIKAWSLSTAAGQGFATVLKPGGACANAGNPCADDGLNTIPGYPEYSRTVTITTGPPLTPTTRLVRVQIQYRRVTAQGVLTSGQQVDIATLIAQH
jgi:prepilin-type N-terminal cleavage/methylation domain-containing protein